MPTTDEARVEKYARAICKAEGMDPDGCLEGSPDWMYREGEARAAIALADQEIAAALVDRSPAPGSGDAVREAPKGYWLAPIDLTPEMTRDVQKAALGAYFEEYSICSDADARELWTWLVEAGTGKSIITLRDKAALSAADQARASAAETEIAARLLAAERRGAEAMRERAARVAEGEVYQERYRTWSFMSELPYGGRPNHGANTWIAQHSDEIAIAIRALSATESQS